MKRLGRNPTRRGEPAEAVTEPGPHRTCVGCRRVGPQARLLRVVRTAEGFVEPDPECRRGGRGAYLCRAERCLAEAVRRGRWAQAFRAPTVLGLETLEHLRALLVPASEPERGDGGVEEGGMVLTDRPGESVEGRR